MADFKRREVFLIGTDRLNALYGDYGYAPETDKIRALEAANNYNRFYPDEEPLKIFRAWTQINLEDVEEI